MCELTVCILLSRAAFQRTARREDTCLPDMVEVRVSLYASISHPVVVCAFTFTLLRKKYYIFDGETADGLVYLFIRHYSFIQTPYPPMIRVLFSVGKHRKHPGGRGNAGGQHHHRILFDKFHPGYFGKVGMRQFHRLNNHYHCPTINVEKLWSLFPENTLENAKSKANEVTFRDLNLHIIDLRPNYLPFVASYIFQL